MDKACILCCTALEMQWVSVARAGRALHFGTCSYPSIKSILDKQLDKVPLEPELPLPSPTHANLRGGPYYN